LNIRPARLPGGLKLGIALLRCLQPT
jgi:hypothetical protein